MNRHALTATAAAVLLVVLLAPAPVASAESPRDASACTTNDPDHWSENPDRTRPAPVRTGPGSEYSTRSRLAPLGLMRVWCSTTSRGGERWYYGSAATSTDGGGPHVTGWVWAGNLS